MSAITEKIAGKIRATTKGSAMGPKNLEGLRLLLDKFFLKMGENGTAKQANNPEKISIRKVTTAQTAFDPSA
jgi:hypothetical protein